MYECNKQRWHWYISVHADHYEQGGHGVLNEARKALERNANRLLLQSFGVASIKTLPTEATTVRWKRVLGRVVYDHSKGFIPRDAVCNAVDVACSAASEEQPRQSVQRKRHKRQQPSIDEGIRILYNQRVFKPYRQLLTDYKCTNPRQPKYQRLEAWTKKARADDVLVFLQSDARGGSLSQLPKSTAPPRTLHAATILLQN